MSDLPSLSDLQTTRVRELQLLEPEVLRRQVDYIRTHARLRRNSEHFRKHGTEFEALGVNSIRTYLQKLSEHSLRDDLLVFTFITTKATDDRMWIFVAIDTGIVAQYNETKQRMWTFFAHSDIYRYLDSGRGWWVQVTTVDEEVEIVKWK